MRLVMADRPFVGPPSREHRAVCLHSVAPGEPQCDQRATRHIEVIDDEQGVCHLSACDRHAPVARAAARFSAEHAYRGYCGLPGTLWHSVRNVCVLDDSGKEPALAGVAEQALAGGA